MKRILVYSHDTYGLGNIRRMLSICRHLAEENPELSVLVISGSPMLHAIRLPERIDYIKLPCLSRTSNNEYSVKFLGIDRDATLKLRAQLISHAIEAFEPEVILVDKKPFGVAGELELGLRAARGMNNHPKIVLILRDILDAPGETIRIWEKNGYHQAIREFYDQIFVVGESSFYDICDEYRFPDYTRDKVRWCGFLERNDELGADDGHALFLPYAELTSAHVLVTVGGGEDGRTLLDAYREMLKRFPEKAPFFSTIVMGPELSASEQREFLRSVEGLTGVRVLDYTDQLIEHMRRADVVVAMGGYNTVCEILSLSKRAVLVPRIHPVQEQFIRAQRLQALGYVSLIHPENLTPDRLISAIHSELQARECEVTPKSDISFNGLRNINTHLRNLLRLDTQRSDAEERYESRID